MIINRLTRLKSKFTTPSIESALLTYSSLCCHPTAKTPNSNPNPNPNPDAPYNRKEQFFMAIFKKCHTMKDFNKLHAHIIRTSFDQNCFVIGKIITFCANSGNMDYAITIFENIQNPDGFLWNTMIRGFVNESMPEKAFGYYKTMNEYGEKVDNFTFCSLLKIVGQMGFVYLGKQVHCHVLKHGFVSHGFVKVALLHMYGMLKDIETARILFGEIPEPELVAWNAILDCHVNCGKYKEVLDLFFRMMEFNIVPDEATIVGVFRACSASGELDFGRKVHSRLEGTSLVDVVAVSNSVIDMYAKCGAVDEAWERFYKMSKRNVVSWSTMIAGLAAHGHADEALLLFLKMIKEDIETPDGITFLGVLSACSHTGRVDEGRRYFEMMKKYHIQPTIQHYGCMVDIFARAGFVEEAYQMVKGMPMECNSTVLRTLLAACRVHGNFGLAEKVRRWLMELEPGHSSDYVLLSNMYASRGQWDEAMQVRQQMKYSRVQKPDAGNSCIGA